MSGPQGIRDGQAVPSMGLQRGLPEKAETESRGTTFLEAASKPLKAGERGLRYLRDEYYAHWKEALFGPGGSRPLRERAGTLEQLLASRLTEWDLDKDGRLGREERRAAGGQARTPEERAALGLLRQAGGVIPPDEKPQWEARYQEDLAAQRALQPLEDRFLGTVERSFGAWDRDGDGLLSAQDLAGVRAGTPEERAVLATLQGVHQRLRGDPEYRGIGQEHLRMLRGMMARRDETAGQLYQTFAGNAAAQGLQIPALPVGFPGGGSGLAGAGPGQLTNHANQAALVQMMLTDMQQAQTIYTQIAADAQKQRAERWKIMSDTQAKVFEITQDVTINKAKTVDKGFNGWDQYIRS